MPMNMLVGLAYEHACGPCLGTCLWALSRNMLVGLAYEHACGPCLWTCLWALPRNMLVGIAYEHACGPCLWIIWNKQNVCMQYGWKQKYIGLKRHVLITGIINMCLFAGHFTTLNEALNIKWTNWSTFETIFKRHFDRDSPLFLYRCIK